MPSADNSKSVGYQPSRSRWRISCRVTGSFFPTPRRSATRVAPAAGLFIKDDAVTDLSRLTDDELELLEKLIAKAEGRFLGRIIPALVVEYVDAGPIESNADEDMAK
jgi:hypothetical protein